MTTFSTPCASSHYTKSYFSASRCYKAMRFPVSQAGAFYVSTLVRNSGLSSRSSYKEIDEGLVILSNQAVTLMKKYSVKKETEKKSNTERKISPFVKVMPLEHYYAQISEYFQRNHPVPAPLYIFSVEGGGLYESGVLHPETLDVKRALLQKVRIKRERDVEAGKAVRSAGKPSYPAPPPPSPAEEPSPKYENITPATSKFIKHE